MAEFETILAALRAAGEATRLRALLLLAHGELTVSELTSLLGQSQPRVSRHLKILADAGLVERLHEGTWTFYRLADGAVARILGTDLRTADGLLSEEDQKALEALRAQRRAAAEAYFDAHAAEWEQLRTLHIAEDRIEATLLELAPSSVQRFFDFGTGTGRMLVVFRDRYEDAIGIDTSQPMLTIARARLDDAQIRHAQVRRSDFLVADLPGAADLVCLHHVLHFLAAPGEAIGRAASVLAPGGHLLIADFAPHTHEELRETHAHRRLGFADDDILRWSTDAGLHITADEALAPPVSGGLVSRIWRLSKPGAERNLPPLTSAKPVTTPSERSHVPA